LHPQTSEVCARPQRDRARVPFSKHIILAPEGVAASELVSVQEVAEP